MEKRVGKFLVFGIVASIFLVSFASAGFFGDVFGKITGKATASACLSNYDPVCCVIDGKSITSSNACKCASNGGSVSYTGVCIVPVSENITCIFANVTGIHACWSGTWKCTSKGGVGNSNNCTITGVSGMTNDLLNWSTSCLGTPTLQSRFSGMNKRLSFDCGFVRESDTCVFPSYAGKQNCSSVKGSCRSSGSDVGNNCTLVVKGKRGEQVIWNSTCGPQKIQSVVSGYNKSLEFVCAPVCLPVTCQDLGKKCGEWDDGCGGEIICPACSMGEACYEGACVDSIPCSESDGGKSYYTKGSACIGNQCKEDSCAGSSELNEYYIEEEGIISSTLCDPYADVFSAGYKCPNGCNDGACTMPDLNVQGFHTSLEGKIDAQYGEVPLGGKLALSGKEFQIGYHVHLSYESNIDESAIREKYSSISFKIGDGVEDWAQIPETKMVLSSLYCWPREQEICEKSDMGEMNCKIVQLDEGYCSLSYDGNYVFPVDGKYYAISSFSDDKFEFVEAVSQSFFEDFLVLEGEILPRFVSGYDHGDFSGLEGYSVGGDYALDAEDDLEFSIEEASSASDAQIRLDNLINRISLEIAEEESGVSRITPVQVGDNLIYMIKFEHGYGGGAMALWVSGNKILGFVEERRGVIGVPDSPEVDKLGEEDETGITRFIESLKDNRLGVPLGSASFEDVSILSQEIIELYLNKHPSDVEEGNLKCFNPKWSCTVNPVICPEYGTQVKKCIDLMGCEKDREEELTCVPGICSGCMNDALSKCIPYGVRMFVDGVPSYCEIDGTMKAQRLKEPDGSWAKCQNSYECESNVCSAGECIEVQGMLDQAGAIKSLSIRVLCRFANLFKEDDYASCVGKYLGA